MLFIAFVNLNVLIFSRTHAVLNCTVRKTETFQVLDGAGMKLLDVSVETISSGVAAG